METPDNTGEVSLLAVERLVGECKPTESVAAALKIRVLALKNGLTSQAMGGKSRKRLTLVVGKKPNGKSQTKPVIRKVVMKTTELFLLAAFASVTAHAQNIFVSTPPGYPNGTVAEYSPIGNLIDASFTPSLSAPGAIAFDGSGDLFVANGSVVSKFNPSGNVINANFATGLNAPDGLVFDSSGNLYAANSGGGTVSEIAPNGSVINASFASGLSSPEGLAFDSSGNLYVANYNSGTVSKFAANGNLINASFVSGLSNPKGLAFDSSGNLYVSSGYNNGMVSEYGPSGNLITTSFAPGVKNPEGLAFDSSGDLWVANSGGIGGQFPITEYNSSGNLINTLSDNDFLYLMQQTFVAIQPVPEPASLTLLTAGAMALFSARRMASRQ
jgi:DNA-binding beta-propeller fold protein YncE